MGPSIGINSALSSARTRRRLIVGALSAAVVLAVLGEMRLFRLTNGLLFDVFVTSLEPGSPQSILVRAQPTEIPLAVQELRRLGATPSVLKGSSGASPLLIARPAFGVTRRFVLPNGQERLIALPGDATMPALSMQMLRDRVFPAGSLTGLWAVIGSGEDADPPRFHTSGLADSRLLRAAEFRARAIHAWRTGRTAREITGITRFLLVLIAALALPVGFIAAPSRLRHLIVSAVVVCILVGGFLLVRTAGLLIPITELLLVGGIAGFVGGSIRRIERERRLGSLADQASSLANRNSLLPDPGRWIEFFSASARLTGVENSLIIEERSDGRFEIISAFGPVASRGLPQLSRTAHFDDADNHCPEPVQAAELGNWRDAHLVRLDRDTETPIYWLYSAPAQDRQASLAAASRLARAAADRPGLGVKSSTINRKRAVDAHLSAALNVLVSHASELRSSFAALQTAVMLFDSAGVPLQLNASMERLLVRAGLQPTRATPVDVAVGLAGLDPETARQALGNLVRCGGEVSLPPRGDVGNRRYVVRVTQSEGDLLFEAIDVTELHRLSRIHNELASEIDARIRNDLEAVELASRLASDQRLPPARRERALAMIGQATERTRSTLDDLGRLVDATIYVTDDEPYPVNPRSAVDQAVSAIAPLADSLGVRVEVNQPTLAALVLAEPISLDALLRSMLEICLRDSSRGATVQVVLTEGENVTEVVVTGGFGLPADHLAAALATDDANVARPTRIMRQALQQLNRWGASLAATSEAGQGYTFKLELKKS